MQPKPLSGPQSRALSRIEWLSCPPASFAPRAAIGLAAVGRDLLELLHLKYIQFRHRHGI